MIVKFNKFERVAGLFVLAAVFGGVAASVGVAIKKGWFEARVPLVTNLQNADGIREGTQVQIAGLNAGTVTSVDLKSNNEILVHFDLKEKFRDRVRTDSIVRAMRPFIIGDKVLDISVGSDEQPVISKNAVLNSERTFDVMDFMSGRSVGPYVAALGGMVDNLRYVAEALLEPKRAKALVKLFDELHPLVKGVNVLLSDVNSKGQLKTVVANLVSMTNELTRVLPVLAKDSPQLAADLAKIAKNMAILTDEVQKSMPMFKEVAPELPRASRRAIEALDETVVTLKALQKSFILRGNVQDVRAEEKKRDEAGRQPAALPTPNPQVEK